jgi:tetratricopeptide (TPR) repeat protein
LPAFGRTIACFLSTALCWGGGFPLDTAPGAADPSGTSERRPEDRPGVRAWLAGDGERALQELEAAASRGRDRLLELNRAVALLYLGRGGEAETLLVALHARERRWAPALRWLARAQKEPGRAEVVETAAALVALSGAEARDHYWAARLFAERKDLARARDGFARAVREEPDHYLAWLALGDAEAALGRREGARRAWSVARELYGGGDELFRLGRLLWEDGRRSEARSLFREALETREATLYEESVRALDPGIDAVAPPPLPSPCSILGPGEVLRYRAKFLFFHLANLTLEDRGPAVVEGQPACRLAFAVKSKPGVPFLRIDSRFESTIAREGPVLRHRNFTDEGAASRRATSYEMDPDRRACTVRQVTDGVFGFERLAMPPGAQDGISVIQLARAAARTGRAVSVLTAVDGTWKGTQIRPGKTEKVRWRGRELPAVRIEMVGHYRGPAGLSGAITLWISADERAVPYRARFKIGIGSVTLELEPGREPPVAPGGVLKPEVQREAEQSANAEPVLCLQGVHFELLAQHPDAPTPPHGSCSCRRRAAEGGRRSAAPLPRCPPRGPTSRRSGLSNRGGPTAPLLGGGRFI